MEESKAIVIDNGSGFCKAGFANYDSPISVFPPYVGCRSNCGSRSSAAVGSQFKDQYVGDEAPSCKNIFCKKPDIPFEKGIIADWEGMEKVWHHLFYNELRVTPDCHPVLITETPNTLKSISEKMTEIMFEKLSIPSFYKSCPSLLSLYSSGRTTGLVLDIGDNQCHSLSIFDGYVLPGSINFGELAGRDLSLYLIQKLLLNKCFSFRDKLRIAEDIKKMYCKPSEIQTSLCSLSNSTSGSGDLSRNESLQSTSYELPDGKQILIDPGTYTCPNIFFSPKLLGSNSDGVQKVVSDSLMSADSDIHSSLMSNFILSGGSTLFPGFESMFENEICKLVPTSSSSIEIVSPHDRQYSAWIGGSLLASQLQSTHSNMWVSKLDYNEHGSQIIHKKCY